MRKHLRFMCGQAPRFLCPYCNRCSNNSSNMYVHVRRAHKGRDVFLIDAYDSSRHTRHKSPESKYPCGKCNSVFNRKTNLNFHVRWECGQPPRYKCPYCHLMSKKTTNIRIHIQRRHLGCEVYVDDVYLRKHVQQNVPLEARELRLRSLTTVAILAGKAEVPMRPMRKCLQPERQPMLPQEICLQPIAEVLLPLLRLSVSPCVQYACACPQEASWNKSLRRRHF
ncbi:GSCOCG00002838001-RA-CDS [Cotesia congregata]|nr:GSCOCG00002838001-RA-CDS [Cotesia congregata]